MTYLHDPNNASGWPKKAQLRCRKVCSTERYLLLLLLVTVAKIS